MLRHDRQSPCRSHTLSMGVGEGLAQKTEIRHQENVDISSAQKKRQLTRWASVIACLKRNYAFFLL